MFILIIDLAKMKDLLAKATVITDRTG